MQEELKPPLSVLFTSVSDSFFKTGASLVIQWLRIHLAQWGEPPGSIPGLGRSHMSRRS